jgi:hypothetical protein
VEVKSEALNYYSIPTCNTFLLLLTGDSRDTDDVLELLSLLATLVLLAE